MGDLALRTLKPFVAAVVVVNLVAGCGRDTEMPTRTPVPTWTPTAVGAVVPPPAQPADASQQQQPSAPEAAAAPPPTNTQSPPTETPIPAPPTETPTPPPAPTEPPTETPTPAPTATPLPTPTPDFPFILEVAEKFPTDTLAPNVVRIWLYAYSPAELGLADYSLRVTHDGAPLIVEETTAGGVPAQTRSTPGPFTRFTNLNLLFVEPQAGSWELQLIDAEGVAVGPPALFEMTSDEITREFYVRYKQVAQ